MKVAKGRVAEDGPLAGSQGHATIPPLGSRTSPRDRRHRPDFNPSHVMVACVLAKYERAPDLIEAVGPLNRWPGRTGCADRRLLQEWEAS